MSDQHYYLPISKITAGMVLATELLDKQGHVLLPAGVIITKQMLASFLLHEIHQVSVLKHNADLNQMNETQSDDIKQRIRSIFRHTFADEPINKLEKLISTYRLGETP